MDVGMPDPRETRVLCHDAAEPPLGSVQSVLRHHRPRGIEEEGVVVAHEAPKWFPCCGWRTAMEYAKAVRDRRSHAPCRARGRPRLDDGPPQAFEAPADAGSPSAQ